MKKIAAIVFSLVALHAQAGVIIDNSITGSTTNTFDAQASGNVAGFISELGATYGEHFLGQTVSGGSGFDVINGTPTSLTLVAAASSADNIGILSFGTQVIYGDLGSAIGEGALSIRLDGGSEVFGLQVVGTDGGAFLAQFFAADGSVIGSISQGANNQFYGFRATSGDLIYGISITNTDAAGIGFDNVTFNQARANDVPEPASLALFGLGMLGFAAARRRK